MYRFYISKIYANVDAAYYSTRDYSRLESVIKTTALSESKILMPLLKTDYNEVLATVVLQITFPEKVM